MVDRNNAHIRTDAKQDQSSDLNAAEAERLMNDPALKRGFQAVQDGLVNQLLNAKSDGSEEYDAWEREICRSLRTLTGVKRALSISIQGKQLREAGFQSQDPENSER